MKPPAMTRSKIATVSVVGRREASDKSLQSLKTLRISPKVCLAVRPESPTSSSKRALTKAFSSSVNQVTVSGKSAMSHHMENPTIQVSAPSAISKSAPWNGFRGMVVTKQENPSPGGVAPNTLHLTDGSGEQTTESASQRSRGEEESVTLLDLITLVPPVRRSLSEV